MIAGTILCDDEFTYSDGTKGRKILIVLCNGNIGYYIVVKTTSKEKNKTSAYGCNAKDRYQNFFLPKDSCCLREAIWIMLDQFFEFTAEELLSKHFAGQIKTIGNLPKDIVIEILQCAITSDDISSSQAEMLKQELQHIKSAA